MRTKMLFATAAVMLTSPLAACASDAPAYRAPGYAPPPVIAVHREEDGLLAEPPADAKAGQCFAKVVVRGQAVYGPPIAQAHVRWIQNPPQPGTIGPVWCQIWEQGYQPSVSYTPERYGWIRVICDHDATVEKIGHIQHRLHDWGYYQGGYGGKYDDVTAQAVKRFQTERHIEHGGYLSFKTMEALEGAPPPPPPPPPVAAPPVFAPPVLAPPVGYAQSYPVQNQGYQAQSYQAQAYQAQGYAYQQQTYAQPVYQPPLAPPPAPFYRQPVYQPPIYQQPVYQQPTQVFQQPYAPTPCPVACQPQVSYAPQPCGPNPCQGGYPQPGPVWGQGGYGQGGYIANRRWLTWSGKAGF